MTAYYNENDPKAAAWLRELIAQGLIAKGDVDERSIKEVTASDVAGYTQCHFFAGIGGWSYALRLAGWPDDRPVWTGSCPCQPFSAAGKQKGTDDARHLWPDFARLIRDGKPTDVFGEQVASKLGREWLAGIRADLERMGYAVGAADLCAASVGAPHIRQRLYWVADTSSQRLQRIDALLQQRRPQQNCFETPGNRPAGGMANADGGSESDRELQRSGQHGQQPQDSQDRGLGDSCSTGLGQQRGHTAVPCKAAISASRQTTERASAWLNAEWLRCLDGKARRFEPSAFPLAHGIQARMGRLRGYGNAIVPQVAEAFIRAYEEARMSV